MFQGVLKPPTSLLECQRACLEERNCLGVDWSKQQSASTTDSRRCYFVYPESTRYGVQPASDYCCDHYRRTYCLSTSVPRPGGSNTTTVRPTLPQHPAYTVAPHSMSSELSNVILISHLVSLRDIRTGNGNGNGLHGSVILKTHSRPSLQAMD